MFRTSSSSAATRSFRTDTSRSSVVTRCSRSATASSNRPRQHRNKNSTTTALVQSKCNLQRNDSSKSLFSRGSVRRLVAVDARLDLPAEVAQQPLHRPGCPVAQRADGVAFDLGRHVLEQVDLALLRLAALHALQHAPHPAAALAAGRALAAALMLVEVSD